MPVSYLDTDAEMVTFRKGVAQSSTTTTDRTLFCGTIIYRWLWMR